MSSRKIVPRWATSKRPALLVRASVTAPRSCPKSSSSMRVSGTAEQDSATSEASARGLRAWIARATSSFPVPVAPVMSTDAAAFVSVSIWRKLSKKRSSINSWRMWTSLFPSATLSARKPAAPGVWRKEAR